LKANLDFSSVTGNGFVQTFESSAKVLFGSLLTVASAAGISTFKLSTVATTEHVNITTV